MQMSYRYVWFADSSCACRIPWAHPMERLLCEATCTPVTKQAGAIRNPPLKGWPLNSQASGNICSPEIHTCCQLGLGWAQGLGKEPLMQLWPRERPDQDVLWLEKGGGSHSGGCLAVTILLCLKGGRDHICSKLQEADELLICWVAVSLGPCSQ